MDKKAQHIIFGTMFMLFVFFFILTLFLDDIFISPALSDERYELINHEARRASTALLLDGYPEDWNETDVQRAGLVTDGLLDHRKIASLKNLSLHDYGESKEAIGVRHDYLINISTSPPTMIGEPGLLSLQNLTESKPRYLARQTRTTIDPNTKQPIIITLYVYRHTP